MIARGKRRLAAAILAAFTAWPIVHFALVRAYDLDPWKFGGWAMYTVTGFLPKIDVFALGEEGREQLGLGSHRFLRAREAHEQLVFDTKFYGTLADAEPLARAAADEVGEDVMIEIAITRFYIDPQSARISARRRSLFYEPLD